MSVASRSSAPRRRRTILTVAAAVAALAVVYALVVALYAAENRVVTVRGCTDEPPPDAVRFSITPQTVDAVGDRMSATLAVDGFGPLGSSSGLLDEPVTVIVSGTDGAPSFTIAADEIPSPRPVKFVTTGEVEQWPFDTHAAQFAVVTLSGDGADETPVPTVLCGSAHVPGWAFSSQQVEGDDDIVIDGEAVTQVRLVATRSPATVAFGIVILALLVVLPVLALTVAVLAYRGARKVEATLTSWMAAMLFATVPLRTFLPGSPPIGSWVDYLVVLWVVAGLVAALAIYVAAWVRWAPPGGRAHPSA